MIFHENCLLPDNSHVISYLLCRKLGKMSQNLSSAAVVIGALRVNTFMLHKYRLSFPFPQIFFNCTSYNSFLVYCRELAPGTVTLTGDWAKGDDSKHDSHYRSFCIFFKDHTLVNKNIFF